jgi:hypothetical protein
MDLSASVTVIAAVWHHQKDKEDLLRAHMANLDRQTTSHERIYVFDEGDVAPDWLIGNAISARDSITLYQAWNVALSQVQTPFVMNLNLDDRLAVDAVAVLLETIEKDPDNYLAGGDWKICATAEETDAVEAAYPLDRLPPTRCWPPVAGLEARIGSGDGNNTLGPACLWRMDAHRLIPRYPYRFADGTLVRVIGDVIWWHLLIHHAQKKLVRTPLVIGNYRTWPGVQAEFRYPSEMGRSDYALL